MIVFILCLVALICLLIGTGLLGFFIGGAGLLLFGLIQLFLRPDNDEVPPLPLLRIPMEPVYALVMDRKSCPVHGYHLCWLRVRFDRVGLYDPLDPPRLFRMMQPMGGWQSPGPPQLPLFSQRRPIAIEVAGITIIEEIS